MRLAQNRTWCVVRGGGQLGRGGALVPEGGGTGLRTGGLEPAAAQCAVSMATSTAEPYPDKCGGNPSTVVYL